MNRNREFEAVEKKLEPALRSLEDKGIHARLSPVIKTAGEAMEVARFVIGVVRRAVPSP